jgi:hypothetical protein
MKLATCIGLAAALAGCAGPVYEGQYAYDDGWTVGHVVEVGPAQSILERGAKDCRPGAIAQGLGGRTFARVAYHRGHLYRSIVSVVRPGDRLVVGDPVYVNYQDCGAEIVPRHFRS